MVTGRLRGREYCWKAALDTRRAGCSSREDESAEHSKTVSYSLMAL